MKKFVLAVAICTALSACKKEDAVPAEAADSAVDITSASAGTDLPKECEDYLNRAKACFVKSGGNEAAAAFQQGIDQAKAQWQTMADKRSLDASCKMANEQFAQIAAALRCE